MSNEYGEKCARCGEIGEDRRTLWMECFYAMEELGIPFEEHVLLSVDQENLKKASDPKSVAVPGLGKLNLTSGTVTCVVELYPRRHYTLRVCKDCRADWLNAIGKWFHSVEKQQSTGTGAFIRENGATREMTEEEVEIFRKTRGCDPVRVRSMGDG